MVEVADVQADPDGRVTGAWDTLVNPGRDVGATSIHGITAQDVLRAPTFAQVAPGSSSCSAAVCWWRTTRASTPGS